MTIIVGIQTDRGVIMGADSMASTDYISRHLAIPKVFKRFGLVIGCSGAPYLINLLTYGDIDLEAPADLSMEWMVRRFVPALREAIKAGEFDFEESSVMVGRGDKLFTVYADYSVVCWDTPYAVIGSGSEFALGSLTTSSLFRRDAETRVKAAIWATERYCPTVGGATVIVKEWED